MGYDVELVGVDRERTGEQEKASVVYNFSVTNGQIKTHANIILTYGGAEIIEQRGKDPKSAARIALERLLRSGRDPFETRIFLRIPHGHADYFSRYGNYDSLPVLTD
jgi:hypothetical protein